MSVIKAPYSQYSIRRGCVTTKYVSRVKLTITTHNEHWLIYEKRITGVISKENYVNNYGLENTAVIFATTARKVWPT